MYNEMVKVHGQQKMWAHSGERMAVWYGKGCSIFQWGRVCMGESFPLLPLEFWCIFHTILGFLVDGLNIELVGLITKVGT